MRKVALLLIVVSMSLMSSCSLEPLADVTPEERELLGVKEGEYYSSDHLEQLRAGIKYIEGKYEGLTEDDFEVYRFSASDAFNPEGRLWVRSGDRDFTVLVSIEDDGYHCSDTYYGYLIEENYDNGIEERLSWGGVDGVACTEFPQALDKKISADDLLLCKIDRPVMRNTSIYLHSGDDFESRAKKCEEIIVSYGIYGSYTVYEVPNDWSLIGEGLLGGSWVRGRLEGQVFENRYMFTCFNRGEG